MPPRIHRCPLRGQAAAAKARRHRGDGSPLRGSVPGIGGCGLVIDDGVVLGVASSMLTPIPPRVVHRAESVMAHGLS